jgi:hypothetical protein
MSSAGNFNYAREVFGIRSLPAAIIFAVLYAFLLPYYLWRASRNRTYVLIILSLFCAIRVTAFVIRATLAASDSAGSNLSLCIGEQIVYSVGFFGLLYSVYTLVLDREMVSGHVAKNPIARLTSNRHLIRFALMAAVAIGIVGSVNSDSSSLSTQNTGKTLRRVSTIIFLVVTALLAIHTLFLIRHAIVTPKLGSQRASVGTTHGMHVLGLIIALLLVREIYLTITVGKIPNEAVWYPLAALTEIIAVFLFSVPGLVPDKHDMIASQQGQYVNKDPEATAMT